MLTISERKLNIPIPEPEQVLSFSGISSWKRCRYSYYYSRVRKLKKKTAPLPLKKGSAMHTLLETHLKGNDWRKELKVFREKFDTLMEEEKVYYGDLPGECQRIMEGYIEHWKDYPVKTLAVEVAFGMDGVPPLEIVPGVFMKGRIDWLFRDHRGLWVCDHKTVGREIPNESYRLQDLQTIIYSKALPMLGFERPVGCMFDYIKTKTPSKPKLLQNGTLSKSKKVGTDYRTFLEAIKEYNLKEEDYSEQLEIAKRNMYYARKYIAKPKYLVNTLLEELSIINLEIKYLKNHPYRNLGRDCNHCSYMPLCTAEMCGLDTDFILKTEYMVDDKNEEEVEPEDGEDKEVQD